MKTIEFNWKIFEREVIPPQAGDMQRGEMRKAFYAGAISGTLDAVSHCGDPDGGKAHQDRVIAEMGEHLAELNKAD